MIEKAIPIDKKRNKPGYFTSLMVSKIVPNMTKDKIIEPILINPYFNHFFIKEKTKTNIKILPKK